MSLFDELRAELERYLSETTISKIYHAYEVAAAAHEGQKRRSGEPYITHPLAVAKILAEMHMDAESLMAAIMHDVIEDTEVTKEELVNDFGEDVAELVDGVSKLTQMHFKSRVEQQAENFRKMVLAMAKDIRVILIKLADRLHNMRTLEALSAEKKRRIATETLEIYAPIANRLGINAFKVEFEDRGFKILYPVRSRVLAASVLKLRGNRQKIFRSIEKALVDCLQTANIPATIKGREKHLYSTYKKMARKKLTFSEVNDVIGFRIIVDTIDDCYRVLGATHNLYKPLPGRFKDYIAIPKANGYQSLHTVLFGPYGAPIEIQIRTEEMNHMAETGIASHWLYKSEGEHQHAQDRAQGWVRNLLELQKSAANSIDFIENVKVDLFPDEVYVFTPKGQIMELPAGATAVDFAYAVHTDVGNSCIAAKIDKRLAPLSTRLENGQTLEVITAPGARPNAAWLSYVVTGKARSNIRHFLKKQQRSESIALGKRLLEKSLETCSMQLDEVPKPLINDTLHRFNLKSFDDLLEELGLGNRSALLLAKHFSSQADNQESLFKLEEVSSEPLAIKGTEGMVVSYAKCCYPIPGDPIVGYLSAGRGLVVHSESCQNATLLGKSDQRIPILWDTSINRDFQIKLLVDMENYRGALAQLANVVSDAESNIENITTEQKDNTLTQVTIVLSVKNRVHLARVMRRIRSVKPVTKIIRARTN